MRLRLRIPVLLLTALAVLSADAAEELVVDLSAPVVAITTGFTGADLLLFGVTAGEGDVVVVVRGPARDESVRRKERIAGIWVNRDQVTFKQVPSFYTLAANRPLVEFLPLDISQDNQIGLASLDLKAAASAHDLAQVERFRQALVRNKQRQGLYGKEPQNLTFLGNRLFRTNITFPANVTVGTYGIDVYLIRDNKLVKWKTTLMSVRKFGFEAGVFDFAHRHALAYGVLAVLIAAVAGWLGSVIFRRA